MRLLWTVDCEVRSILPILPEEVLPQGTRALGSSGTFPEFWISDQYRCCQTSESPHGNVYSEQGTFASPSRLGQRNRLLRIKLQVEREYAERTGDRRGHRGRGWATADSDEDTNGITVTLLGCRDSTLDADRGHEDHSFSYWCSNRTCATLWSPSLESRAAKVVSSAATHGFRNRGLLHT